MSDAKSSSEPSIDEILSTIRRIIADDEQGGTAAPAAASGTGGAAAAPATASPAAPAAPPARRAAEKADDADDILELTEAVNEDGTTRHLAPIGGGSLQRAALRRATTGASPPPAEAAAAPSPAEAASPPRDLPLAAGQRTLEDLVREALRPLLQAWLDQNLPPLVERLVQAEVAKARTGPGAA